jgi:hypothetical protein
MTIMAGFAWDGECHNLYCAIVPHDVNRKTFSGATLRQRRAAARLR